VEEKLSREGAIAPTSHHVDRPGFDFGGSTGETSAGLGLGLKEDSSDAALERSLPGRRMTGKLSIPCLRGPNIVHQPV
jgi:hypothetical protein